MKRGSKKKTYKKTYKRKTYKRKTNRVKTNRVKTNRGKTNRGKTNKRKNKNYRRKKGKSLKGGLRRYLRKKDEDYKKYQEDFKTRETPLIDKLGDLVTLRKGTTGQNVNSASENDEEIERVKGQIKELGIEKSKKKAKNIILKAIVEGKSFETYKQQERPEGDASGLKKQWDEVLQILGNRVNAICKLLGFNEEEWKRLTEDSQNRETNIRNILIGIDHTIQYQLDNPGKDGSDFGMLSSFLGQ